MKLDKLQQSTVSTMKLWGSTETRTPGNTALKSLITWALAQWLRAAFSAYTLGYLLTLRHSTKSDFLTDASKFHTKVLSATWCGQIPSTLRTGLYLLVVPDGSSAAKLQLSSITWMASTWWPAPTSWWWKDISTGSLNRIWWPSGQQSTTATDVETTPAFWRSIRTWIASSTSSTPQRSSKTSSTIKTLFPTSCDLVVRKYTCTFYSTK